jgi:ABC-type Co2+ transport system permease subunit
MKSPTANVLKLLAGTLLFGAWGALILTHQTAAPGADVFISWIQGAIVGLGIFHLASPSTPQKQEQTP